MLRHTVAVFVTALLLQPLQAEARGHGGSHGTRSSPSHSTSKHGTTRSTSTRHSTSHQTRSSGTHHSRGTTSHRSRIKRDPAQRRAFMRTHPCPSTGKTSGACPGYVVDHVDPLKRGGADRPSNMAWQTVAQAKAKDKWE